MHTVLRSVLYHSRRHIKLLNSSAYLKPRSQHLPYYYRVSRNYCVSQDGVNEANSSDDSVKEDDEEEILFKQALSNEINKLYGRPLVGHNIFLIQVRNTSKQIHETVKVSTLKMNEAVALVETLPQWKVMDKCILSSRHINSKQIFGNGTCETLKQKIQHNPQISAVFIGLDMLSSVQCVKLEQIFGVKVFDRYQVVLQIFHDRAHTKEAKLQIALAEIPYLRVKLDGFSKTFNYHAFKDIGKVGGSGETSLQIRRHLLMKREIRLKQSLEKVRKQRQYLRNNEQRNENPIIAVVGYTNCGKTTLIKSLTNDARLQPEDKLFATLDVTFHPGLLSSMQKVLYVDTVGFISDVPTSLIQCFRATLEDVTMADLIIHVRDISHPDTKKQKQVVLQTLAELDCSEKLMNSIIEVGNKIDLIECTENLGNDDMVLISAARGDNLNGLVDVIEEKILENTEHGVQLFRVPNGGEEYSWLMKQAAIRDSIVDEEDANYLILEVVISDANLSKFVHSFGDLTISVDSIMNR